MLLLLCVCVCIWQCTLTCLHFRFAAFPPFVIGIKWPHNCHNFGIMTALWRSNWKMKCHNNINWRQQNKCVCVMEKPIWHMRKTINKIKIEYLFVRFSRLFYLTNCQSINKHRHSLTQFGYFNTFSIFFFFCQPIIHQKKNWNISSKFPLAFLCFWMFILLPIWHNYALALLTQHVLYFFQHKWLKKFHHWNTWVLRRILFWKKK